MERYEQVYGQNGDACAAEIAQMRERPDTRFRCVRYPRISVG